MANIPSRRIRFGSFELDTRAGDLRKGDRRIRLQAQPFQILLMLLEHPGEVVTREEICKRLWPAGMVVEFDHSIGTAVKKLRQALGDEAESPRYVETLPRRGFRFIFPDVVSLPDVVSVDVPPIAAAPSAVVSAASSVLATPAPVSPTPAPVLATPAPVLATPAPVLAAPAPASSPSSSSPGAAAPASVAAGPSRQLRPQPRRRGPAFAGFALALVGLCGWLAWYYLAAPKTPAAAMLDESSPIQVTASPGLDVYPSFSPDGSSLAYSSDQSGSFEIYVKSLAPGGQAVQLTSDGAQNLEPTWSPDGRLIAYHPQKFGGIWVIPALGGSARMISDFGSWPAWSPDSSKIVFQSDPLNDMGQTAFAAMPPSTLWVVSVKGGAPTQLTRPGDPPGGHGAPSWSPDGRRILFSATSTGLGAIWSIPADGGEPRLAVANNAYNPVYGPDGRSIYFSQGRVRLMRIELSPEGAPIGKPQLVGGMGTTLYKHVAFSANGRLMAYTAEAAADNLWQVRLSPATSEAVGPPQPLIYDTNARKTFPLFSPDGRRIAFELRETGSGWDLRIIDAGGKNAKNARSLDTTSVVAQFPGWFPGGQRLASDESENGHNVLESVDVESGRKTALRELPPNDTSVRLSPDGSQIAFGSRQDGAINIWTAPTAGGPGRQLTFDKEVMDYPCWSPDGKLLAFEMKRGDNTYVGLIPSKGGTPIQLNSTPGQSWVHDWSPDGDKIVFAGLRRGLWNVWWVSRRDKTERQVTFNTKPNVYVRYPAWSPRGDTIVYEYVETTGNIWLMHLK